MSGIGIEGNKDGQNPTTSGVDRKKKLGGQAAKMEKAYWDPIENVEDAGEGPYDDYGLKGGEVEADS